MNAKHKVPSPVEAEYKVPSPVEALIASLDAELFSLHQHATPHFKRDEDVAAYAEGIDLLEAAIAAFRSIQDKEAA